ncbi:MAG: hypothetical protein JW936_06755 [Sedimentisphaerales bacterium]|nr:hypothetical protein [Sedimentisphaerales bacterium]
MNKKINNNLPIDQLPSDDPSLTTDNLDEIEKTRRDVMLAGLEALRHIDKILKTTAKPDEPPTSLSDRETNKAEPTAQTSPAQHQLEKLIHPAENAVNAENPKLSLAEQILAAGQQAKQNSTQTAPPSDNIVTKTPNAPEQVADEPTPQIPTDTINASPIKEIPDKALITEIMTQIVTSDINYHRNQKATRSR